jgi:hypothetical protein
MESFELSTWTNFIRGLLVHVFTTEELSDSYEHPLGLTGEDVDLTAKSSVCFCQRLTIKFFEMKMIKETTELLHFTAEMEANLTDLKLANPRRQKRCDERWTLVSVLANNEYQIIFIDILWNICKSFD